LGERKDDDKVVYDASRLAGKHIGHAYAEGWGIIKRAPVTAPFIPFKGGFSVYLL
jgi:hypothetical protein